MSVADESVEFVRSWLDAVNAGDVARAIALSSPDIEIVGPRGTGRGGDVLRRWIAQAGATFHTLRTFAADGRVVVAQHATWRDEEGSITGEAEVASRFRVVAGQVTQVERHGELAAALSAASLDDGQEVGRLDR